jgi:hypothetical protein
MRTAAFDSALLFVLAAVLIWPLFQTEYFDNWMSIDGAFIGDIRYLSEHLPSPGWAPHVYCGNRFDYLYPPAMRYGSAVLARFGGLTPAHAYHVYSALLYCVFGVGVYVLVRTGSGSRGWAVGGAVCSLALSPALLIFRDIRADSAQHMPQRLNVIVKWGEVPHMSALAVLLLAIAACWVALRSHRPGMIGLAALLSAACVSNNFYGATALAIFFLIAVWTVWVTNRNRVIWGRAIAIALLSYGLTAFWLTPSYLVLTVVNLKFVSLPPDPLSRAISAGVAALFAALSFWIGKAKPERAWPLFLAGSVLFFGAATIGGQFFQLRSLGEPTRFVPEFELFLLVAAIECLRRQLLVLRVSGGLLLAACAVVAWPYLRNPWGVYKADPHPERRIEYRLADWIARNLPGSRVHTVSSLGFWEYTWRDVHQVGGISDQGVENPVIVLANWQIREGHKPQRDIHWLQALGADAVVVHGKRSSEIYHAIRAEKKYENILPVLHDSGEDDIVYRVPRRWPGLARVVNRSKMASLRVIPWHDENEAELHAYAETVEQGPDSPASTEWLDHRTLRVRARVRSDESVTVQVTYDPAWRAESGGQQLPIHKDVMNLMRIDAPAGDHEILLRFETPLENQVGRVVTGISIVVVVWLMRRHSQGGSKKPA